MKLGLKSGSKMAGLSVVVMVEKMAVMTELEKGVMLADQTGLMMAYK